MKVFDSKYELTGFWIAALLLLGILPSLNAFTAEGSIFHFSSFQMSLWGK